VNRLAGLVGRLAARLQGQADATIAQRTAAAFALRQQAQAEVAELADDLTALRAQLTEASAAVISPHPDPAFSFITHATVWWGRLPDHLIATKSLSDWSPARTSNLTRNVLNRSTDYRCCD
jgi:hypothetical protein